MILVTACEERQHVRELLTERDSRVISTDDSYSGDTEFKDQPGSFSWFLQAPAN
jgi:hypothetical protein